MDGKASSVACFSGILERRSKGKLGCGDYAFTRDGQSYRRWSNVQAPKIIRRELLAFV